MKINAFANLKQIFLYYQAGIINILFGYGLFALFLWLGLNLYLAQILAHCIGVVFNYFTYSRLAFAGFQAQKTSFAMSYVVNYLLGLGSLIVLSRFIVSEYVAGLVATIIVSLINYFVLKKAVFRTRRSV